MTPLVSMTLDDVIIPGVAGALAIRESVGVAGAGLTKTPGMLPGALPLSRSSCLRITAHVLSDSHSFVLENGEKLTLLH